MLMKTSKLLSVVLLALPLASADAQTWERLGPDAGSIPWSFEVTETALYVGMTDEDWNGLGLHRYVLDSDGPWELLAWEGIRVAGIAVWGEADENILVLINDLEQDRSEIHRSTDGGATWMPSGQGLPPDFYVVRYGLFQAPSDTSRFLAAMGWWFSSDGGWSWERSSLSFLAWGLAFNPSDALVAYLVDQNAFGDPEIRKSTDGGASWFRAPAWPPVALDIAVERESNQNVATADYGFSMTVSTDSGESWNRMPAPLGGRRLASPPWSPSSFFVCGADSAGIHWTAWQTPDLGQTWASCGDGLPELPATPFTATWAFLIPHPADPVLFAALEGSGVWRLDLSGAAAPEDRSHGAIQLAAFPNPSAHGPRITWRAGGISGIHVIVLDGAGRVLRKLRAGTSSSSGSVRWDGRDNAGRPVASGIYHVALVPGNGHPVATHRILILR